MWRLLFGLAAMVGLAGAQEHPRDKQIKDADTLAWWHTTEALAGNSMEGRDTGSAAYQRAAAAAAKFNEFFYRFVEAIANGYRPEFKAGSSFLRGGPQAR